MVTSKMGEASHSAISVAASSRGTGRVRALALRLNLKGLAIADGLIIGALCGLGAIHYWVHPIQAFWLDGEHNFPATFSTLLLIAAAGSALLFAGEFSPGTADRRIFIGMGALFAFMSFDEFQYFHEHFNDHFHFPWQVAYAPVILAAAYLWVRAWRELRALGSGANLWLMAAAAWAIAQSLDLIQNTLFGGNNDLVSFRVTVVIEEGLEMVGSSLFAFALLVALRSLARRTGEPQRL